MTLVLAAGVAVWTVLRGPEGQAWTLFWAALAGGIGLGLGGRAMANHRARRGFFRRPQPVHPVRVVDTDLGVYVLFDRAGSDPAGTPYVMQFPVVVRFPVRLELRDGPRQVWRAGAPGPAALKRARPGLLYGDPIPGRWCAVVVDSCVRVPAAPIEPNRWEPIFGRDERADRPAPVVTRDADGPAPAVVEDADRPAPAVMLAVPDRSPRPEAVRSHRVGRIWGYGVALLVAPAAVAVGALVTGLVACALALPLSLMVVATAAATGVAVELVWRRVIRPRAAWNGGGVAVVTPWTVAHLRWDQVRGIDEADGVRLRGASGSYAIRAIPWSRWLPAGERSAAQLLAALQDTRRRALSVPGAYRPDPPELAYPRRPVTLWVLWLVDTALLTAGLLALPH